MTTVIGGSSPSITFSDSTTQSTAALPLTGGTVTADIVVHGLTIGQGAGSVSTNTAVGVTALNTNSSGIRITAFGYTALYNATGNDNTAIGARSQYTTSTGTSNNSLGRDALYSNTSGSSNQAIGVSAMYYNTTGSNNTALGDNALANNTTASYNTAVGYQALYTSNRTADTNGYNTAMGAVSGQLLTTGQYNTFVGGFAGQVATTGTFNSFYGVNSGSLVTTGSNNSILGGYSGNQGGLDIRTGSNYVVLSDGAVNIGAYWDTSRNMHLPTSGSGIIFNNSSALTNSTLNDYETGTWAPTQGGGLTVVGTFSSAGTYTKIGNTVYITGRVSSTTSVALSAGGVISALPFACLSTSPGLSIAGRICNNSGSVDIASYVSGSSFASLSGSVAVSGNIFFTAVYQATF